MTGFRYLLLDAINKKNIQNYNILADSNACNKGINQLVMQVFPQRKCHITTERPQVVGG